MKGQWIFVFLCLSFVGQIALGSIFPPITQDNPPIDMTATQQEVQMPLTNLTPVPEVSAGEAKIYTRTFPVEQHQEKNLDNGQTVAGVSSEIIVVNTEQKTISKIVTRNNTEKEIELPTTDN